MVLSGEPFSGFGFLRSVSPGAASRRRATAEQLPIPRACVALPHRARRPVDERRFFAILTVYSKAACHNPFVRSAFRPIGDPLTRPTTPTRSNAFVKTCLEWCRQ
jgi:hypothetical protein